MMQEVMIMNTVVICDIPLILYRMVQNYHYIFRISYYFIPSQNFLKLAHMLWSKQRLLRCQQSHVPRQTARHHNSQPALCLQCYFCTSTTVMESSMYTHINIHVIYSQLRVQHIPHEYTQALTMIMQDHIKRIRIRSATHLVTISISVI